MEKFKILCIIGMSLFLSVGCEPSNPYHGDIYINDHASLDDFEYTDVFGNVIITETTLVNLEGMESLKWIEGDLEIVANASLTALTGLENLGSVDGSVTIWLNPVLSTLTGLDNLEMVGGGILIGLNASLTNLTGVDRLNSASSLVISANAALTTLTGLDSLNRIDEDFAVANNITLPTSLVEDLRDQVLAGGGISGDILICENLGGDPCP